MHRRLSATLALALLAACQLAPGQAQRPSVYPTPPPGLPTAAPTVTRTPEAQAAAPTDAPTDMPEAAASTPPPDGTLATREPGAPTPTPLPDGEVPPSLPITELVPFTHEATGISGLRPSNWTLFGGDTSFQISSSPAAPDGFIGKLLAPEEYPQGGAKAATRQLFDGLKKNQADGPAPKVSVDELRDNGSGRLAAEVTGNAQGSTRPFRLTIYARTTATPRGLLIAIAIVPAEQFPSERTLIFRMVDSLALTADGGAPAAQARPTATRIPAQARPTATPPAAEGSAAALTARGLHHERTRRWDAAMALYDQAIAADPTYRDAHYYRAVLEIRMGNRDAGLRDFRDASAGDEDEARLAYHTGRLDGAQGDDAGAIGEFTRAIALRPDFADAYYVRCVSYSTLKRYATAIADCSTAMRLSPALLEARAQRGLTYLYMGDDANAERDLKVALEVDPDEPLVHYGLGRLRLHSGAYTEALGFFSKAIELAPDLTDAYCERGQVRNVLGDYEGAVQDTTKALELDPHWDCARYTRARAYYFLGQPEKAIADLDDYLAVYPNEPMSHALRGKARLQIKDFQGAVEDETAALRFITDAGDIYETRGEAYAGLGRRAEAATDLRRAADLYRAQGLANDAARVEARLKQLP